MQVLSLEMHRTVIKTGNERSVFSFLHFKAFLLKRRFQFGWSLTTVTHPAKLCVLRVIKYYCCGWVAHQGWDKAAALFGRSGSPLTEAPELRGGDVTKGQACSFLAGAGREMGRRLFRLVPGSTTWGLKLARQPWHWEAYVQGVDRDGSTKCLTHYFSFCLSLLE